MEKYDLVVITGPTAGGKTSLAARLALQLGGEVVSADSRQVYRSMDIGTGKDLDDYVVDGVEVPNHLIDIVDPGYKYNVYEYQRDFLAVYNDLKKRSVFPVVCGGSGMYVDSIISGYRLIEIPPDPELRIELEKKTMEELTEILRGYKHLHNNTDIDTKKRAVRAIEIEMYYKKDEHRITSLPEIKSLIIGIKYDREIRRERISQRLRERLDGGMIEEVKGLLERGLDSDTLIYYGLEYKYLTLYLTGNTSYDEMFRSLETAIHRFAKRQMTWFRGMERKGILIHWLDGEMPVEEKIERIISLFNLPHPPSPSPGGEGV
jgi:tRNA dimethylallyltransferase